MWSGGREDTSCEDSWRISSINVLGALFWKWPIVIKDSGFEKNEYDHGKMTSQIQRDICGKTDLIKVGHNIYHFEYYLFI